MWYKMQMLHFIDVQFFDLFRLQFCLIWFCFEKKDARIGEHVYQEFVMLEDVYSLYKVK